MSVPKLISPMLDNFNMGDPISEHNGVRCCPAMEKNSDAKYIVKIISVPSAPSQLDALLLSGAYPNAEAALDYFKSLTDGILAENRLLEKLTSLGGFVPFDNCQIEPMEAGTGFDVYLLSPYTPTLHRQLSSSSMTHLEALNLGMDLCSALSTCRQSGYLYTNLKPENIYITADRGYRIGDLGFLKLSSLKYASLPDRYRSEYTAPEITDAYSELNTTIDVYAVGLILYQVYNNGALPFSGEAAPGEMFPSPAYADYEMTEIILKACAPDPAERWQDPEALGQALVAYMQRNGANDVPIIPFPEDVSVPEEEETVGSFEAREEIVDVSENEENSETNVETAPAEEEPEAIILESDIFTEDENGNLTFLTDDGTDETLPDEQTADIPDAVVSDEVSDMLQQADELISHPAPEPVVQPEPIDVPIPEMILPAETDEGSVTTSEEAFDSTEAADGVTSTECESTHKDDDSCAPEENTEEDETESENKEDAPAPADTKETDTDAETETEEPDANEKYTNNEDLPKKRSGWKWLLLIAVLIIAIAVGSTYFYQHYYLQTIDSIKLEENDGGILTVMVETDTDNALLSVVCTDTYGNHHSTTPLKDGKASLKDLTPDRKYTITIEINGFHKLTGDTSITYSTPNLITVEKFTAEIGNHDGEILLQFKSDAPETFSWFVSYQADDGSVREEPVVNNKITVSGLTVGKKYNFTLSSPDADNLIGETTVSFTAKDFIAAENLTITGCINNVLTLTWDAPVDTNVSDWTVHCTGGNFSETKTTNETIVSFTVPDDSLSYSLEVIADGMPRGEAILSPANALTIADLKVDESDPTCLKLSWEAHGNVPTEGWKIWYSIDGIPQAEISTENTDVRISPAVPESNYSITVTPVGDMFTMGGSIEHQTPTVTDFEGYGVIASDISFTMCLRPEGDWDRYDISDSEKRTEFTAEDPIGFLLRMNNTYNTSSDKITILYVFRDADGNYVDCCTDEQIWDDIWSRGHGTLNMPLTPQAAGAYSLSVYFSGALVHNCNFTISN